MRNVSDDFIQDMIDVFERHGVPFVIAWSEERAGQLAIKQYNNVHRFDSAAGEAGEDLFKWSICEQLSKQKQQRDNNQGG